MTTQPSVLSATTITGDEVVDPAGDKVGKIEDLMIDTRSGDVRYAVVSFGGVMGIGDKLFAVPMEKLAHDAPNHRFAINMSKDRLKDAPGFDKNEWPDFADQKFSTDVTGFYA